MGKVTDSEGVREEAERFVRRTQRALGHTRDLSDSVRSNIQSRLNDLRHCLEDGEPEEIEEELESVREYIDEHADLHYKSAFREYAESIGFAVIVALFLRAFVIEAFKIPTGSMIPTLKVGDHLFVNKFIYGVRVPFTTTYLTRFERPSKGEVVVFSFPAAEARKYIEHKPSSKRKCIDSSSISSSKDFIKRIVGTEGDRIAIRNNHLYVNGDRVMVKSLPAEETRSFLYPQEYHALEKLGGHRYEIQYKNPDETFGPITVRDDHVFVLGDNRDESSDSRCWGQVPIENIKGRAMFIWWSVGPESYRWHRIGQWIH
ncbi:MAG: signal peptidase I [Bradymonadaceae bacterium]